MQHRTGYWPRKIGIMKHSISTATILKHFSIYSRRQVEEGAEITLRIISGNGNLDKTFPKP